VQVWIRLLCSLNQTCTSNGHLYRVTYTRLCVKLVIYKDYTEMHGRQNVKVLSKVYNVYLKQFSVSIILKEIRGRDLSVPAVAHSFHAEAAFFYMLLYPNIKGQR